MWQITPKNVRAGRGITILEVRCMPTTVVVTHTKNQFLKVKKVNSLSLIHFETRHGSNNKIKTGVIHSVTADRRDTRKTE